MIERLLMISFLIALLGFKIRHRVLPRVISIIRLPALYKHYLLKESVSYAYDLHNGVSFSLAFDGYSAFLTLLIIIILPLVMLVDDRLLIGEALLAESSLIGLFLSRDAVLMMIFREISLVAVFLMVLQTASKRTSVMYLAFAQAGALLALVTIFYAFYNVGSSSFEALKAYKMPKLVALSAVIGFGIEVPLFPLHTRFIRTIRESSISTAIVLMFRNGIFGIFRLFYLFPIIGSLDKVFFYRGTISVFYAYLSAFGASKVRELIAFLAMGHMSFARIALPKLGVATYGALYYMSIHPLILSPLVMIYVAMKRLFDTEDLLEIRSLQHRPVFSILLALSLLLAASVPVSAGFVAEILTIIGMMSYGKIAIIPIFAPVILMSVAVYYIREILYGSKSSEASEIDKSLAIVIGIAIALAFIIVLRSLPINEIKEVVMHV